MKLTIDRKERIVLGGVEQAIHIWGTKQENPVVLFLHGGPGVPNRHGMAKNHMDLTDDFTIVAWDQRGTGGAGPRTSSATNSVGTHRWLLFPPGHIFPTLTSHTSNFMNNSQDTGFSEILGTK